MKKDIHPQTKNTVFKCACGNEIQANSLDDEVKIEICSACHPFFTGKQKLVDSAGRVERFMKKYGEQAAKAQTLRGAKKAKKAPKVSKRAKAAAKK